MKLVQHLLDAKGGDIVTVAPQASVLEAIRLMAEHAVGSLLVMQGDTLAGIVTERDYARKVIIKGRSSNSTEVGEIMTGDVVTAAPEQTVNHCMEVMTREADSTPAGDERRRGRRHRLDRRPGAGDHRRSKGGDRAPRALHQWLAP